MEPYNMTWSSELAWRGYGLSQDQTFFCEAYPLRMSSYGLWERTTYKNSGMRVSDYPLPYIEIMILSAFFLWQLFDVFFKKLRLPIPSFSSMMLAGVVLGLASYSSRTSLVHEIFFPDDKRPQVPETVGAFGFAMYWFIRGVTADVGMVRKAGRGAALIGFATMVVPIISGSIVLRTRMRFGKLSLPPLQYRKIIFLQSFSAFVNVNTLLKDLKINHSEFGRIAQSSAAVTELLLFFLIFLGKLFMQDDAVRQIASIVTVIALLVFVLRPATLWMIRQTPEGSRVKETHIYAALGLVYLCFHYWEYFSNVPTYGLFLIGLAIPSGPPLGSALVQRFENFNFAILMPVFGSLSMTQLDLPWLMEELKNLRHLEGLAYEAISLILILTLAKFVGSTLVILATKMPLRDSVVLALVLCNKGLSELHYIVSFAESKRFDSKCFTISAASVLLNSLLIPLAIDLIHEPAKSFACYQERNLTKLKPESELQALVCIHKPDNITSMINFLETFPPSQDSPMACSILHLVQLVDQSNPTFISHQLQKPKAGSLSCSDNVINSFRHLYRDPFSGMTVDMFTSISFSEHMHEDVCWLALDKNLTLILLPFHRSWTADGSTILHEDKTMMNVSRKLLKRAPCSVGIFVCRRLISPKASFVCKVCLILVGGKDDTEALAFTNRMRYNERIALTFVRFVPRTADGMSDESGQKLKAWVARHSDCVRAGEEDHSSATFMDNRVEDSTETLAILQTMAHDYDMFIVGRRSGTNNVVTRGLEQWTEFEELGVIGDLLASSNYCSNASVLVVQQQDLAHR